MIEILFLILLSIFSYKLLKEVERKNLFSRYSELLYTLERAKNTSYSNVFRSDIIVQSSSGFRINKNEIDELQKKYVKLVLDCCGPTIVKELTAVHGSLDSICIWLVNDFISKVEEDEATMLNTVHGLNSDYTPLKTKEQDVG